MLKVNILAIFSLLLYGYVCYILVHMSSSMDEYGWCVANFLVLNPWVLLISYFQIFLKFIFNFWVLFFSSSYFLFNFFITLVDLSRIVALDFVMVLVDPCFSLLIWMSCSVYISTFWHYFILHVWVDEVVPFFNPFHFLCVRVCRIDISVDLLTIGCGYFRFCVFKASFVCHASC
jgi:hypothetical protein